MFTETHFETQLTQAFLAMDLEEKGLLRDRKRISFVLRAAGSFPHESHLTTSVMTLPEMRALPFFEAPGIDSALEAFLAFDPLNSGKIKRTDLMQALTSYGEKMTEEEVNFLLSEFDEELIDYNKFVRHIVLDETSSNRIQ